MSLRRWAFILGIAWVGLAAIDADDAERTQTKPAAPSTAAAPKISAKPVKQTAEKLSVLKPKKRRTLYVTGSVVNVRRGPSTAYAKLFQLRKGLAVKELEKHEGWIKLSSNGRSGWMSEQYLSTDKPPTADARTSKKRAPQCHPNYSGACVPIARDVDCAGGSGNGPAYVRGPIRVIGRDVYRLDRDKDGIGCE
jgi:uncharacterized protein YgiM (DUF1202 family)